MPTRQISWTSAIVAMTVLQVAGAAAQAPMPADNSLAELERGFWACDHEARTGLVDFGTATECSRAFEALKSRKFDGDFTAMLAWWRRHKAARYLADEAARQGAASQRAPVRKP